MRISAIFLLPAEVLVTDSESHTHISYFNTDYSSIWFSFRDMGMGQTDDIRQGVLPVVTGGPFNKRAKYPCTVGDCLCTIDGAEQYWRAEECVL